MFEKLIALVLLAGAFAPMRRADAATLDGVPQRVLFVGNSYTGGCEPILRAIFANSRHAGITLDFIKSGGNTLTGHLGTESTLDAIANGGYDAVVLQEQSQTPAYPGLRSQFLSAASQLDLRIRSAGAETVLFQTWGRRDGDSLNPSAAPDYTTMQDLLTEGYVLAAANTGAHIAQVGEAWRKTWEWDPAFAPTLYHPDGSHQSDRGAYLAACVFFLVLTGEDPGGVNYRAGLPYYVANPLIDAAKQVIGWEGASVENHSRTPWSFLQGSAGTQYQYWADQGCYYFAGAYYHYSLLTSWSIYYTYYGYEASGYFWQNRALAMFYYYHYLQYGDWASAAYWYNYFQSQANSLYSAYS